MKNGATSQPYLVRDVPLDVIVGLDDIASAWTKATGDKWSRAMVAREALGRFVVSAPEPPIPPSRPYTAAEMVMHAAAYARAGTNGETCLEILCDGATEERAAEYRQIVEAPGFDWESYGIEEINE